MSDDFPGDQPSAKAQVAWRCNRDLNPLFKLLRAGGADADAQRLAAELLEAATRRKLPDTRKDRFRTAVMLSQWAMARSMGTGSEAAKQFVAEMFNVSVKAIEKAITNNPEFVAQLRAELKF